MDTPVHHIATPSTAKAPYKPSPAPDRHAMHARFEAVEELVNRGKLPPEMAVEIAKKMDTERKQLF